MTAGQELARQGQDDALAAATVAHLHHLDEVRWWFDRLIEDTTGEPGRWDGRGFTAEDVRENLLPETVAWLDRHPNLLPAFFAADLDAARRGERGDFADAIAQRIFW